MLGKKFYLHLELAPDQPFLKCATRYVFLRPKLINILQYANRLSAACRPRLLAGRGLAASM